MPPDNIVAPNSDAGDVTIDTHAIAAALLRPFSGEDQDVRVGLGNSGPASGATERDILPRQMQSIAWEALRGLYSPSQKGSKVFRQGVDNVWDAFGRGEIDRPAAQQKLIGDPSRITPPSWYTGSQRWNNDRIGRTAPYRPRARACGPA